MESASPIRMTDPARELIELCEAISEPLKPHITGEHQLAQHFEVAAWSREFYQIIFTIGERVELLASIIQSLELDEDFRDEIVNHVRDILRGFSGAALQNHWTSDGQNRVNPRNVQPLKGVSGLVRRQIAYKKLDENDIADLANQVATLIEWLEVHQLTDHDFIRQALLDGLRQFAFRLDKLRWLGWGYTLKSLREVIGAYMLLDRSKDGTQINPDSEAVLRKVSALIKTVYERVQVTKAVVESGDFLLRAYGLGALWYQGQPAISGLLGAG